MAAILDLRHIQTSGSLLTGIIVLPDQENMGIAVGILLLSCIIAEIRVTTLFQPPSWISDFRFHLAVLPIAPFKSLTLKTWVRSRRNFVPIAGLEAEIHLR